MALPLRLKTMSLALSAVAAFGVPAAGVACGGPQDGKAIPDAAGPIAVVGVLTEFASLCVNGLKIHYEEQTPVTVNGRRAHPRDLALGQVVAVEARAAGGQLAAQNIAIVRALEGPVTGVDAATGILQVMDRLVRLTDETMGHARDQVLELKPGAVVQVSGLRNARGEVVASRIDVVPARSGSGHSVIGHMRRHDARNGDIEGLRIALPMGMRSEKESDVLVRGLWDGAALRAGAVAEDPAMDLLGRVDRAVVESLVHEPRRGSQLRVGALQVRVSKATRIEGTAAALRVDQSVQVTGVPDRRSGLAAERIRITPAGRIHPLADRRQAPAAQAAARAENAEPGRYERMGRDNPTLSRVERLERADREAAPERIERPDARVERPAERPEPTRVERPEINRIIERLVERPERPEKAEKVERPERSERSGSNSGRN